MAMWLVIVLSLAEVYFMFPFENKGDFAEVGRFIVNVFGSIVYLFKAVLIAHLLFSSYRASAGQTKSWLMSSCALATPLLVLSIHGIVHPNVATARTLEAYMAAPQLAGHLLGLNVQ